MATLDKTQLRNFISGDFVDPVDGEREDVKSR